MIWGYIKKRPALRTRRGDMISGRRSITTQKTDEKESYNEAMTKEVTNTNTKQEETQRKGRKARSMKTTTETGHLTLRNPTRKTKTP